LLFETKKRTQVQHSPQVFFTMAQTMQYSKADLLALFRPMDSLPDGFTQWENVVSLACLEPENKAFPDFEIDPNSVRALLFTSCNTLEHCIYFYIFLMLFQFNI